MKRKVWLFLILIIILAVGAGNLVYPKYIKTIIPQFWDIPFRLGLDLQGGTHLLYEADLSNIEKGDYSSAMQGLRDIIERRINLFGVTEPKVQTQEAGGQHKLVVELAGIKEPAEAIKMIGQTPFLEFREQKIEGEGEEQKIHFEPTSLTGKYLKRADLSFNPQTGAPFISLQFNDEGAKLFEELTEKNVGKILAIYIDGIPISTPVVQEKISGGRAQITGDFTVEEAKELVRNLNAGALPVPIKLISQQSVGPTLGAVSLEKSLKAGLIGFLAIIIFLIIFYRFSGFLASLSLAIYVLIVLSLFKLIPVTLTLAGIGGFILSIGMAVDANILIFSRMREEQREGKSFSIALEEGFRRSWPSIRDGNLTTLIVALILFGLGTSFIKGFALTLSLGILVSMFSAMFITRTFLQLYAKIKARS